MRNSIVATIFTTLMCLAASATEVTRTATITDAKSQAVFAVPNGFSFTRASARDARGGSVPVCVGESTVMNAVTLVPISAATPTNAVVSVVFSDGGAVFTGIPAKVIRERIRNYVVNPEDVPLKKAASSVSPLLFSAQPSTGVDVLILSPHDNVALWQAYAAFRKGTSVGADLTFLVKDLDSVYAEYPWIGTNPAQGVRNAAEAIHKYLRDNRARLGFSYVILGGSWINAQHLNAENQWTDNDGNVIHFKTDVPMSLSNCVPGILAHPRSSSIDPSDMFYACLDLTEGQTYPWCVGDSADYFEGVKDEQKRAKYDAGVDVVVSRIPLKPTKIGDKLWTSEELMTAYLAKIERAERADFPGTKRIGSLWGEVWTTHNVNGSLSTEYEFYDDADNMFDLDRLTRKYQDAEVAQREMVKNHISKYYPVRAVDTLSDQLWMKGYATHKEAVAAYFATDRDYAGIDSHGWAGGSEVLNCDNFDHATGLTLLNDVSVPCETGWQDRTAAGTGEMTGKVVSVPCAGEAAIQGPTGGAIASLNNSRTGLTETTLGSNSLSYLLYHESAKAFLQDGSDAGSAWLSAHLAYVGLKVVASDAHAGSFEGGGGHALDEHTLFGDPLIKSQALSTKDKAFDASEFAVSGIEGYVNATSSGDLTLSGEGRLKVLQTLTIGGTRLTVRDGVEGGVGNKVVFAGEPGVVTIETTKRFYLGGAQNASEIVVNGSNAIIDCDQLSGVERIVFNMDAGSTNVIRGIKKDALAGIAIRAVGGTLVFESSDILGGTTVTLEGTTVMLGVDPAAGSLVASGEPLRGTFEGSGIIKYKHGTELMKNWTIAGSVQTIDDGSALEPGFLYSGLIGTNPTGWFTKWDGETFNANHAVLGPKGFVNFVEEGKHPHQRLAAKKGFTLSLYADLSRVDPSQDAVMLSLGSATDALNGQLLLMSDHGRIKIVLTGAYGGSAAKKYEDLFTVTPGYHLYTIERVLETNRLKFYVDGEERMSDIRSFSLGSGLQIGSQFGGLKVGRGKAIGMAVAGLIGFDALLSPEELAAHIADYPVENDPLSISESVNLSAGNSVQAELTSAVFAENKYLGANNGAMTIPADETVFVSGVKLLNASQGENEASLTVAGSLFVTGVSSAKGPYYDFQNGVNAGIMLGHWGGTSTLTVLEGGCVNAPNGDLLVGYTAAGAVNVNGGKLSVKGLTNYSATNNILNDKGSVLVQNNGILEVGAWPIKSATQLGTLPITFNNGTLRGTADWTCPRPLTVSGPMTIDAAGHNLIFSGAITGAGNISVVDSSEGKTGSVIFVGSLQNYTGTISVSSEVKKFGVRREYVGSPKIVFATPAPSTLIVALSSSQLEESYSAARYEQYVADGSTVVFTDYDGYVYQETEGTTDFAAWRPKTYNYDGIDWSYIFLPYERGVWESLINWRTIWTNGSDENASKLFTTGLAPQLTNSNRWLPIILNGAEFQSDDDLVDGLHLVRATRLEGWNPRIGVYNGVHLYIDEFYKFQHGKESDNVTDADKWLRVDDTSRITIAKVGTGNSSGTMKFDVRGENALVFKTNTAGNTSEYTLAKGASVLFERGLSHGTHKIVSCEVQLSPRESKTAYNIYAVKLFDYNGFGSTVNVSLTDNALTLKDASGVEITPRKFSNSLDMYRDALVNGIGGYTILPGDAGLYLAYIDYAETSPTEITISGRQTDLDLSNIPAGVTKVRFVNAWGYFKGSNHEVTIPVEFLNSAAGHAAFGWYDGYSDKYVAFSHATGSGTIDFHGGQTTFHTMFLTGESDFNGSVILTNGNNRVVFGAPQTLTNRNGSSIIVDEGISAKLKDGGIWAAGGLTDGRLVISGTLTCEGRAEIICMPGITGVDNIISSTGYAKSLLTVTPHADPENARTVRVWVLPEGEIPVAEGQLGLGVTDATVTLPSFDMGSETLRVVAGIVKVGEDAAVRAPQLVVVGGAFDAAAKVGDVYYGSFGLAASKANGETITLLRDVSEFTLMPGHRLVIDKNGHEITFSRDQVIEETESNGVFTYLSTSISAGLVYHVVSVDGESEDVSALLPTSFATEHLPVTLPAPIAADKVFHGWYTSYEDGVHLGEPLKVLEHMPEGDVLHLFGYWLPAVATVNGKAFDNWEDAIDAQRVTGFSIVALDTNRLPSGYFVNDDGFLVRIMATVRIGDEQTVYSSFYDARRFAKGVEDAVITLVDDSTSTLVLDEEESVRVNLNDFALDVEAANSEVYSVYSSYDEETGVTTYRSAHRAMVLSIPGLPSGVKVLVLADGVEIAPDGKGDYLLPYMSEVTVSYSVEGLYLIDRTGESFTADVDHILTAPVKEAIIAQIGEGDETRSFSSLKTALDDAQAGETVRVLATPAAEPIVIPRGVTLDIGSHGYADTSCVPADGYEITTGGGIIRGSVYGAHHVTIRRLTLTDDSFIGTEAEPLSGVFGLGAGEKVGSNLVLNGHTLHVYGRNGSNFFLESTTIADEGTLNLHAGQLLPHCREIKAPGLNLVIGPAATMSPEVSMSVKTFRFSGRQCGDGKLTVSDSIVFDIPAGVESLVTTTLYGTATTEKIGEGLLRLFFNYNVGTSSISGGILRMESEQTFGRGENEIIVNKGGTLDVRSIGYSFTYPQVTLNGGTLMNSLNNQATFRHPFKSIVLTADSQIDGSNPVCLYPSNSSSTEIHLNGHTLMKYGAGNFVLSETSVYGPGKLLVSEGCLRVHHMVDRSGSYTAKIMDEAVLEIAKDASVYIDTKTKLSLYGTLRLIGSVGGPGSFEKTGASVIDIPERPERGAVLMTCEGGVTSSRTISPLMINGVVDPDVYLVVSGNSLQTEYYETRVGDVRYETLKKGLIYTWAGKILTLISTPLNPEPFTLPSRATIDLGSFATENGYEITAGAKSVIRGAVYGAHVPTIRSLTLQGDSSFGTEAEPLAGVFGLGTGEGGASSLTLNGYTLDLWGFGNVFFETTTVSDAGTIAVHSGNLLTHCAPLNAPQTKLVFSGDSTAAFEAGATIRELELATTGRLTIGAGQTLRLTNRDTKKYMTAAEMHHVVLEPGATFDYGWQPGKVISINFASERGEMTGETIDSTFAGLVPRKAWVNTTGGNASNVQVSQYWDSDANALASINGMSVSYSSSGTWYPSSATLPFMSGYLDIANYEGGTDRVTIDLSGIPFRKYDVIVYFQGDGNHGFRPVKLTHALGTESTIYGYDADFNVVTEGYADPWGQSNQTEISYEKNAIRVNGLVGSTLTIEPLPRSSVRASVAAIQIVENTDGIITYRRNPQAASNDWLVEDGWLDSQDVAVTWRNPDLTRGECFIATIDADEIPGIKIPSDVHPSAVVLSGSAERQFEIEIPEGETFNLNSIDLTNFSGSYVKTGAGVLDVGSNLSAVRIDEGTLVTYDAGNNANANDARYSGNGTLRLTGAGYHLLNANSLPASTLTLELENPNGVIIPNAGITLGNLAGTKGFRSDYGQNASRPVTIVQSKNTTWTGNFQQGNTVDRIGTLTISGVPDAVEKTLTLAGDYSGTSNTLKVDATGSVNLSGVWKGDVTVDGTFGGAGTIKNAALTMTDGALLCLDLGVLTLSEATSLTIGAIDVAGADVTTGTIVMRGVPEVVDLPQMISVNGENGYTLVVEEGELKVGDRAHLQVTIPTVEHATVSVVGYEIVDGVVSVPYGASITIVYAPIEGFTLRGETSLTLENITANLTPSAPELSSVLLPNQMLYCFHLDGNTSNTGLLGDAGVHVSGTPTLEEGGALSSTGCFKANAGSVVISNADGIVSCADGFTLSFWLNPNALSNWSDACGFRLGDMLYKFEKTGANQFAIYSISASEPRVNNDSILIDFVPNTWMHVAIRPSSNGESLDIFANGELAAHYTPGEGKSLWGSGESAKPVLSAFTIGVRGIGNYANNSWYGENGRASTALVDEVAVFNANLSENQIAWLAENVPSAAVFAVSDEPAAFGTKVIGLHETDTCNFVVKGGAVMSTVGDKYDRLVSTLLIDLPETTHAVKIASINESNTAGAEGQKADLYWNGAKLYFGYNGGNIDENTAVALEPGLHLISMTAVNGNITSGNCGVIVVADGNPDLSVSKRNIRWGGHYPTGTFTYRGVIKALTLDFSENAAGGYETLPKLTRGGEAVRDLSTICEILEMTGKKIDDAFWTQPHAVDFALKAIHQTDEVDTVAFEVETAIDLPYGEVVIYGETEWGVFVPLVNLPRLNAPMVDGGNNVFIVPIEALFVNGEQRIRRLKLHVVPKRQEGK